MNISFDGAERPAIEHFARRGNNSVSSDIHDAIGGVFERVVDSQERAHVFGESQKPDGNFRDQREGSFGADHKAGQIVARRFHGSPADVHNFAIGQDQLEAGHVVGSDTIGECVRPAGILRDIAADRAGFLTGRIGREIQTIFLRCARKVEIYDSRFDYGTLIFRVDLQDVVHARECEDDAALPGQRSAGETGSCAATYDGNIVAIRQLDDFDHILFAARKNNDIGMCFFNGTVVFVKQQIFGARKHAGLADQLL